MIFNSTEYGAPWNDQCYIVKFYLTIQFDDIIFTSNDLSKEISLPGPQKYTEDYLIEFSKECITETYQDLFDYDNFIIHIIDIS